MLGEALAFPLNGDDRLKTHVIGAACLAFGFLILPAILLQGYLVRVLRAAAEGSDTPPSFDEWGDMLVDGLKLIAVGIGYFLVPFVLYFVAVFFVVGGGLLTGARGGAVGAGLGVVGGLLLLATFLLFLVAGFFLPAGMTNFARTDDVGAAFDVGTVTSGALTSEYLVAWVIAIVVGFLLNFVGSMLAVILVGFLVLFYGQVVTYYLFGRGFVRGLGEECEATDGGSSTP